MSDTGEKATLQLRIVGPLDGDETLPMGATAWISAADDEPLVVTIPVGLGREPATVEVSAGRVVVVLRCPNGRRGRREFVLRAGDAQSIEFGTVPLDVDKDGIMEPEGLEGFGGSIGGTGSGGGASGDPTIQMGNYGPAVAGGNDGESWMPQIYKVHAISHRHSVSGKLVKCVVKQDKVIPPALDSFKSSAENLEFGMIGCFAFVVELTAPHKKEVLFHRAPWTDQITRFTARPRHDATAIPIDTEVFLADQNVMPLLSFLASGDIPSARALSAQFSEAAGGYLSQKFTNHHLAAVGAYALHVLRETASHENWIRTLYKDFDDIPDGAILYAMHLMRARPGAISEWYDEARTALVEAAARSIPLLTIGVQLLVEGLERLSSSRRAAGDVKLENALSRAHWIQSRSRPDEIFTALWMDRTDLPKAFLPHDFKAIAYKR